MCGETSFLEIQVLCLGVMSYIPMQIPSLCIVIFFQGSPVNLGQILSQLYLAAKYSHAFPLVCVAKECELAACCSKSVMLLFQDMQEQQ